MVRAALSSRRRIGQGPRAGAMYIPAATVVVASALSALPIVSNAGWYPDFGFLVLIAWRLLRGDVWPAWWAAPLGFINDVLTGAPRTMRRGPSARLRRFGGERGRLIGGLDQGETDP